MDTLDASHKSIRYAIRRRMPIATRIFESLTMAEQWQSSLQYDSHFPRPEHSRLPIMICYDFFPVTENTGPRPVIGCLDNGKIERCRAE
jgi:hypothetical protein